MTHSPLRRKQDRTCARPRAARIVKDCVPTWPTGSAMFSAEAWAALARSLHLSTREVQILRGLFDGQTELAIGMGLDTSAHTVHTHIERLHRKLKVHARGQLILHVIREFLILTATPCSGLPPVCPSYKAPRCPLRC